MDYVNFSDRLQLCLEFLEELSKRLQYLASEKMKNQSIVIQKADERGIELTHEGTFVVQ
jgi:predicted DNA-binding protein